MVLGLTTSEFKCFLAIIFLSSYIPVPRWQKFWQQRSDAHNALVSGVMRCNHFESIFSYLHIANNVNLDSMDKFHKLQPLLKILNKRCMEYIPNKAYFSIDESMVPYYRWHRCKKYIHRKPIRYAYKFWCDKTYLGYISWFQPYQGKNSNTKFKEYSIEAALELQFSEALTEAQPG